MTIKKLVSILTIAVFTTSTLYAGPCIGDNCKAMRVAKDNTNLNENSATQWNTKSLNDEKEIGNLPNHEIIDGILPLDDNEYNSDEINDNINNSDTMIVQNENEDLSSYEELEIPRLIEEYPSPMKLATTLYACEDITGNIIACDNEKKEACECV
jgi:hypothetical protein